jgi:hypothetical protein
MAEKSGSADAGEAGASLKKTALVLIHGMAERRPMEALWAFVRAAWIGDSMLVGPRAAEVYSKPDKITGSFELRRITTRHPVGGGARVDFFEFYWAHLMTGTTVASVTSWAVGLLFRRPASVPAPLLPFWLSGLVLFLGSLGVVLLTAVPEGLRPGWVPPWIWPWALALSVLGGLISAHRLAPVAGDAARYLSPVPENVAARQAIREAGVDLLAKLQATGEYDRVILVGHSLGAVIGYDVLTFAWGRIDKEAFFATHAAAPAAMAALDALERAALALITAPAADLGARRMAYRTAQRDYLATLAGLRYDGRPLWLVSDFVTLGTPLSKAEILLAEDAAALERKKELREAPCCPPWLEERSPPRFSFFFRDPSVRAPHHAAVFGPTVWTNVFFDTKLLVFGDVIAGPVAPLFGRGVLDVKLPIAGPFFRHLHYWKKPMAEPPPCWIRALRRAINLAGHDEAELWSGEHDRPVLRAECLPEEIAPVARPGSGRSP